VIHASAPWVWGTTIKALYKFPYLLPLCGMWIIALWKCEFMRQRHETKQRAWPNDNWVKIQIQSTRLMATFLLAMLRLLRTILAQLQRLHAKHRLSDNLRSAPARRRSVCLWRRSYGPNSRRPSCADPDDTRDLGDVGLWRTAMFAVRPHTASDARFSIGWTWRRFQVQFNPCTTSTKQINN